MFTMAIFTIALKPKLPLESLDKRCKSDCNKCLKMAIVLSCCILKSYLNKSGQKALGQDKRYSVVLDSDANATRHTVSQAVTINMPQQPKYHVPAKRTLSSQNKKDKRGKQEQGFMYQVTVLLP